MKKRFVSTLVASLVVSIFAFGQFDTNSLNYKFCKVIAKSGLKLRHGASTLFDSPIAIPYGEVIQVFIREERITTEDDIEGQWVKTTYGGYKGFVFSGYLEVQKCSILKDKIKVVVPADASVDNFPMVVHCDSYLGIFAQKETRAYIMDFDVLPLDFADTTMLYGRYYRGHRKKTELEPIFYIGGMNITKSKIRGRYLNERFFPFQQEHIWYEHFEDGGGARYIAYAIGQGVPMDTEDPFDVGPFAAIKNYEFRLKIIETNKEPIDLLLYNEDIGSWGGGYAGGGWIVWIGHLNDDHVPEILIRTQMTYKGWDYQLLLSDPNAENGIYKILKVGGGGPC